MCKLAESIVDLPQPGQWPAERNVERPIMNPIFSDVGVVAERRPGVLGHAIAALRWAGRGALAVLLFDLTFGWRGSKERVENENPLVRLIRLTIRRLLFVPIVLGLLLAVLVYSGTHPPPIPISVDPIVQGIYYDPLTFSSADKTLLEAWLVPFTDPKRILADREKALRDKRPAVILVHDYGYSRLQMLPLMRPLHEAGFVVLAVSLRGSGESGAAATTFGINESQDVEAAVRMLRRRPFVDPGRISLVGIGTGATACMLAAQRDPALAALVLDHPLRDFAQSVAQHIGPVQGGLWFGCRVDPFQPPAATGLGAADVDLRRLGRQLPGTAQNGAGRGFSAQIRAARRGPRGCSAQRDRSPRGVNRRQPIICPGEYSGPDIRRPKRRRFGRNRNSNLRPNRSPRFCRGPIHRR